MKKYRKLILIGILLIALTGCTNIIDPETGQVIADKVISMGDTWNFGEEGWFSALIIWPIAQVLNFFASHLGALISIFLVTILIKLLTLKLSISATVQQQKMQLIGPEQQRIEKKFEGRDDEQAKMQKATELQKLFKKHDINPLGALGGAFLQIPVMLAMYQAVMRAEQIINGSVLGQPLTGTPMEGFTEGNVVYISIFVLMAFFQFLSMFLPQYLNKKKMKKYPGDKAAQPAGGNAMMYTSLVMITILALRWGVGMSLYWMVTAIAQLVQTLYIQNKYGN